MAASLADAGRMAVVLDTGAVSRGSGNQGSNNADAAKNDFNLSPSRYVSVGEQAEVLPLDEAVVELREAEEEFETANRELEKVLKKLGL